MELELSEMIRSIPDFPVEGILFRDITTLIKDPDAFQEAVDSLLDACVGKEIDLVVAIEARGFIFGAPMAYELGAGFIPVRKPGRLPWEKIEASYALEYGTNVLEMHKDAIEPGQRVLIVDDLLATGGSAKATAELVEEVGGEVVGFIFLIELTDLKGIDELEGYDVFSLIKY